MMSDALQDEAPRSTKVTILKQRLAEARQRGFRIRKEWLGGETGGACEVAGKRWLFLDLSLSIEEQIEQVEDAMAHLAQWSAKDV